MGCGEGARLWHRAAVARRRSTQAASRTYLGRLIPPGRDGEIYGLYATTGRAVSFMAPGLFGLFVSLMGAQIYGILGILTVVAVGLALLLLTPKPPEGFTTTRV